MVNTSSTTVSQPYTTSIRPFNFSVKVFCLLLFATIIAFFIIFYLSQIKGLSSIYIILQKEKIINADALGLTEILPKDSDTDQNQKDTACQSGP